MRARSSAAWAASWRSMAACVWTSSCMTFPKSRRASSASSRRRLDLATSVSGLSGWSMRAPGISHARGRSQGSANTLFAKRTPCALRPYLRFPFALGDGSSVIWS